MSPRAPDPTIPARSIAALTARRLASGVTLTPFARRAGPKDWRGVCTSWKGSSSLCLASDGGLTGAAARPAGCAAVPAAAGGGVAGSADAPESPTTAMTAPTGATAPTSTLIALRTPAASAGTSTVTLSVSISQRFSPAATASPTDLNHLMILPSDTVSPSCGMRTSMTFLSFTEPSPSVFSYQFTETYWVSRKSMMPSWAPSRPMPLCFMPPKGAAGSETRPRLSPTMPKSSFSETCMPRVRSRV